MNALKIFLVIIFCGASTTFAAPAQESSIRELLTATNSKNLLDNVKSQVDAVVTKSVENALNGRTPNSKQQQAINNMKSKMVTLMQNQLSWEKMEPMYIRLYSESFTEEELGGMLAFYKSPAGQAVVYKMPTLMQKIMVEMQKMMIEMSPEIKKIQAEFINEMKEANKNEKIN